MHDRIGQFLGRKMEFTFPALFSILFVGMLSANAGPLPLDGFYFYQIRRAEDSKQLHSSTLWLKSSGHQLSIFSTVESDPFGGLSRCGGLACNLKVHDKIGTLTLRKSNNGLRVVKAEGSARFLANSICYLKEGTLGFQLGCRSNKFPGNVDMKSIVIFSPGSWVNIWFSLMSIANCSLNAMWVSSREIQVGSCGSWSIFQSNKSDHLPRQ